LALFFAYHFLWPKGFNGYIDWTAIIIATLAAIALFKFKRQVIAVIFSCAGVGLMLQLLK